MSNIKDIKPVMVPLLMDKERHLNYDLNALAILEDRFGSIEMAFGVLETMKINSIITLLWAGLIHEDEDLTEKQVGALISFPKMVVLAGAITEALSESVPNEPAPAKKANTK